MRIRWIRYLLPALLIAGLFFGCSRKPGEKLYTEALAEWKAGNPVRARTLLEKSIRRRPGNSKNAAAYNQLGLLLWEMGETDAAADAFSESCRMETGQYDALCNLGAALCAQGEFESAERILREASLMRPDDVRPLAFAGIAYLQNRKWEEARRNLQHALGRTPGDARLETALALAELHAVGAEAALKRLQAVAARDASYVPASFNIATIYRYWLKNPVEARRWYEHYLDKTADVENTFTAHARKQLEGSTGADTAAETSEKLSFRPPRVRDRKDAEKNFKKAVGYHKDGKLKDAVKWYIRALEEDDSYEQAFYNLGLVYYADEKMELAGEAFALALKLNPAFYRARYNGALVDYQLGRFDRAQRELEIVLTQQADYQPARDLMERLRK